MKFFLELVACCSSSVSRQPVEETRLLVVQETPRRAGRKRGRGGSREWRPSLTSISEENAVMAERGNNAGQPAAAASSGWRRCLKRKVASMSQRDRSRSRADHRDYYRTPSSTIMPTFAPTPFMF